MEYKGFKTNSDIFDIIVIGSGPAGISTSLTAYELGLNVLVIDEQSQVGGQIYKSIAENLDGKKGFLGKDYLKGKHLYERFISSGIEHWSETSVWQITENKEVKFVEGTGIDINWTDTDNGTDGDPYDLTFTIGTLNQNTTGSAATLTTARNINGVAFNGSQNITVTAAGTTLSDTVPVSKGGTGATSFADKAVIITQDSGTDTLAAVAMSTNGQLLIGGGSGPAVGTLTAGSNVTITNADGGITIASTNTTSLPLGIDDSKIKF